jgi:hypothetical protein
MQRIVVECEFQRLTPKHYVYMHKREIQKKWIKKIELGRIKRELENSDGLISSIFIDLWWRMMASRSA